MLLKWSFTGLKARSMLGIKIDERVLVLWPLSITTFATRDYRVYSQEWNARARMEQYCGVNYKTKGSELAVDSKQLIAFVFFIQRLFSKWKKFQFKICHKQNWPITFRNHSDSSRWGQVNYHDRSGAGNRCPSEEECLRLRSSTIAGTNVRN